MRGWSIYIRPMITRYLRIATSVKRRSRGHVEHSLNVYGSRREDTDAPDILSLLSQRLLTTSRIEEKIFVPSIVVCRACLEWDIPAYSSSRVDPPWERQRLQRDGTHSLLHPRVIADGVDELSQLDEQKRATALRRTSNVSRQHLTIRWPPRNRKKGTQEGRSSPPDTFRVLLCV